MTLFDDWTVAHLPEKPRSISTEGKLYDNQVIGMTAAAACYLYRGFLKALTLAIIRFIRICTRLSCPKAPSSSKFLLPINFQRFERTIFVFTYVFLLPPFFYLLCG